MKAKIVGRWEPGEGISRHKGHASLSVVIPQEQLSTLAERQMSEPVEVSEYQTIRSSYAGKLPKEPHSNSWRAHAEYRRAVVDDFTRGFSSTEKTGRCGDESIWLYRGYVVAVSGKTLDDNEARLLACEAVLKREKRFQKLSQLSKLEEKLAKACREPIPDDVKMFVWKRDEGRCVKCGSRENLEFDHIIPVSKGGSNTARNLQLLCESCNRSKSDSI